MQNIVLLIGALMDKISANEIDNIIYDMFRGNQLKYLEYKRVIENFVISLNGKTVDINYTYSIKEIYNRIKNISDTWKNIVFEFNEPFNTINVWDGKEIVASISYITEEGGTNGKYYLHYVDNKLEDLVCYGPKTPHLVDDIYQSIVHRLCIKDN
jgi:hypothetical protein